jgi:hypothetical protein
MYSSSAARACPDPVAFGADAVTSAKALADHGWSSSAVRAQLSARRWQRVGRAVIRHNGPPTSDELSRAALINLGPRSLLTSFTGLEAAGLTGWEREPVHVIVPRGARVRRPAGLRLRIHYTDRWADVTAGRRGVLHAPAEAALLAAASFAGVRPACAILAATVQQRLVRPAALVEAVARHPKIRHHHALVASAHDIAQGSQALSEIDFVRLCRRFGLPEPIRQSVRCDRYGRRRYLDAEFRTVDGKRVVVEVDGALHLIVQNWWGDQLRQNEFTIAGDLVLRYPSVVVRAEQAVVADQLRRMIGA